MKITVFCVSLIFSIVISIQAQQQEKYSRIKILRNPNTIIIKLRLIKFNNFLLILKSISKVIFETIIVFEDFIQ